ncbi:MAG: hypothetical protein F4210_15085 [Holophagales bacterium]|nr:hypothetical protein [Holophagales bacterium]
MSHRRWLAEYAAVRPSARSASVLFLLAGLILAAPAAAQLCEGASSITRLGGTNRFSAPVEDQESLQALFANQREDILSLLGQANWTGDPDDLFAAVAAWRGVTSTTFDPGQRVQWMFFRERGQTPTLGTNLCWAGGEAFAAWEIRFNSNGRWYSMIVPESCGNLALLAEQPLPKVTLDLDIGGLSCSDRTFDFQSSCADRESAVTVRMPDGSERSAASGGASFPFTAEGDYTVTATCSAMSSRGDRLEDSLSSTIAVGCPSCSVTASPAEVDLGESSTLTVAPNAGHGAELSRVLLDGRPLASPYTREMTHDGADAFTHTVTVETNTGQSAQCSTGMKVAPTVTVSIEPDRVLTGQTAVVTVAPENGDGAPVTVTLDGQGLAAPYERGVSHATDGEFTHTAMVENAGGSNEASATMKVDRRWTLMPTLSSLSGDDVHISVLGPDTRDRLKACVDGVGVGLAAEYRLSYPVGFMFGANTINCEVDWWLHPGGRTGYAGADIEMKKFFVGLNFHLTRPGSRVDWWLGPVIAQLDYSSPSLVPTGMDGASVDAVYRPEWPGETVLGANMGLKIPFKTDCPVGLYLGAFWFDSSMKAKSSEIRGDDGALAPAFELRKTPVYVHAGISIEF